MRWWPFRHETDEDEAEAMRQAELNLTVAKQMEEHATEAARVHADILRRNNLGPKFRRALTGGGQ